jgi:hypothetical protein
MPAIFNPVVIAGRPGGSAVGAPTGTVAQRCQTGFDDIE